MAITVQLRYHPLKLDQDFLDFAEAKIQDLNRLEARITICELEFSSIPAKHSGEIFRCDINLDVPGDLIRGRDEGETAQAAFDMAYEKVEIQLRKRHDKHKDHLQQASMKDVLQKTQMSELVEDVQLPDDLEERV